MRSGFPIASVPSMNKVYGTTAGSDLHSAVHFEKSAEGTRYTLLEAFTFCFMHMYMETGAGAGADVMIVNNFTDQNIFIVCIPYQF